MELRGKRVVVVGLAQTGVRVARFAVARGAVNSVLNSRIIDRNPVGDQRACKLRVKRRRLTREKRS